MESPNTQNYTIKLAAPKFMQEGKEKDIDQLKKLHKSVFDFLLSILEEVSELIPDLKANTKQNLKFALHEILKNANDAIMDIFKFDSEYKGKIDLFFKTINNQICLIIGDNGAGVNAAKSHEKDGFIWFEGADSLSGRYRNGSYGYYQGGNGKGENDMKTHQCYNKFKRMTTHKGSKTYLQMDL